MTETAGVVPPKDNEPPLKLSYCLINGAFLHDTYWSGVAQGLEEQGHRAFMPPLPRTREHGQDITIDDYVTSVSETMGDAENQVVAVESEGFITGIRYLQFLKAAGKIGLVRRFVVFGSVGAKGFPPSEEEFPRHPPEFDQVVTTTEDGYRQISREGALKLLLHDVEDKSLLAYALDNLVESRVIEMTERQDSSSA